MSYIYDIGDYIHHAKCIMYADDIKMYMTIKHSNDVSNLQEDLDRLSSFFDKNGISVNVDNCIYIYNWSRYMESIYLYIYILVYIMVLL